MKAGIIGAGALGSLFAHYFNEHNIDFVLNENNQQTVLEIKNKGLYPKKRRHFINFHTGNKFIT